MPIDREKALGADLGESSGSYGPDDVIGCVRPLFHGAGGMVVVSSASSKVGAPPRRIRR